MVALTLKKKGGVAAPGQRLMEIVPDRAELVVEAQVSPQDAADLHAGMKTRVRLSAAHDRSTPVLEARLARLSPDSFVDEHTGRPYFKMEVKVESAQMAGVSPAVLTRALKPGLPVEVLTPLRKRTALQYWIEPMLQMFGGALHER